jgi:hypothetical protein
MYQGVDLSFRGYTMCNRDRDASGLDAPDCLQPRHGPFTSPTELNSLRRLQNPESRKSGHRRVVGQS